MIRWFSNYYYDAPRWRSQYRYFIL